MVAALTLPVLISKYKHKELETRFKKSYSLISQASQGMEMELGSCERDQADNIVQYIADEFKVIKSGNFAKRELGYQFKTYNLEATNPVIHPNCFDFAGQVPYLYLITADGTTVALCTNNTYGTMVSIDTNGFNKGPNAYGHDLFFFHLDKKDCKLMPFNAQWRNCQKGEEGCDGGDGTTNFGYKWTEGACSRNSHNNENGFICTKYALENKCPDDSEKSYWDCLP